MARKSSSSSKGFIVDFSKDEGGGGGGVRLPEGDYRAKLLSAKPTQSSEKGTKGLEVVFQITEGKYKGKKVTDRLWSSPKAIWRFRSLLEAFGVKVPKKAADVLGPLLKLKGRELGITLSDDEYEGRIRSRVSDFIDLDALAGTDVEDDDEDEDDEDEDVEDDDSDDEDDADSDDEDEDDDDEEEDEDDEPDYSDLSPADLKKELKKRKVKLTGKFSTKKAIKALEEDDEGDDDDDDDDEIEDIELDEL